MTPGLTNLCSVYKGECSLLPISKAVTEQLYPGISVTKCAYLLDFHLCLLSIFPLVLICTLNSALGDLQQLGGYQCRHLRGISRFLASGQTYNISKPYPPFQSLLVLEICLDALVSLHNCQTCFNLIYYLKV